MESFLTTVSNLIREKELPALMIGGHAVNQLTRRNTEQDWGDVIALAKANKLSLDDPDFSAIVLKHGGQSAIDRIKAAGLGEP
jgi:hypothetical protein